MYGDNEVLLGKWFQRTGKRQDVRDTNTDFLPVLKEKRSLLIPWQIFLATKFGNHVTPEGGREIRNDAEYIRQSVTDSLKKLQTDYIDLLYWYVPIVYHSKP